MLNVSQGYPSIDVYAGSTNEQSADTFHTVSPYFDVDPGTYNLGFTINGVTTDLQSMSASFSTKTYQTFVAYGDTGSFATLEITEDGKVPASGTASIQLMNAAPDAGTVDVYLTASTATLDDTSPTFTAVSAGTISTAGFVNLTSGTYRMRVTASGSKTDIRLDVASVTLTSESISSVILSDTVGGVLVDAMILPQQGTLIDDSNVDARVRAVAGVATGTAIDASVAGVSLLSSAAPATISDYGLVASGISSVSLSIGGATVSAANQTLTAGSDYTLLIWTDSTGTPQETLINESNSLAASGNAKIRLINSMSGLGDPLSMTMSNVPEADSIALGAASAFASVADGATIPVGVTDATTSASLYTGNVSLTPQGVYTLFMFGTAASPAATLQPDR
jgi:hypothetical protein